MRHLDKIVEGKPVIVAVDFDDTLCSHAFPDIGEPNEKLIGNLIVFRALGNKLILWTCREGELLQAAIEWCASWGLYFDAVNENVEHEFSHYRGAKRKIYYHFLLDDKAIQPDSFDTLMNNLPPKAEPFSNGM